jgi:hypothetical protein
MKYRILSIDAWRNQGGWEWNNWFHVGDMDTLPDNNRELLWMLREKGILSDASKGLVSVEDDQYNKVILAKGTREPLFAIEYGNHN